MSSKWCSKCGIEKPLHEFYKRPRSADGRDSSCCSCVRERALRWYHQNPERGMAAHRAWVVDNPRRWWALCAVAGARRRARLKGVPCSITLDDILPLAEEATKCPAMGLELRWPTSRLGGRGGPRGTSPSLDRLHPARGYVPGNVRIISMQANRAKADHTVDEILKWKLGEVDETRRAIQRYVLQHCAEDS